LTRNFNFFDVQTEGARRLARISQLNGVSRFVHVSHLNADHNSPSTFYRFKAAGEEAVSDVFPGATIVRPAALFGHEDKFLNSIANWPHVYRLNHGRTKVKPVHVSIISSILDSSPLIMLSQQSLDVAAALDVINDAEATTVGKTISLPGPKTYTMNEVYEIVEAETFKKLRGFNVPRPVASLASRLGQAVWWPVVSPDEITRRFIDDKEPEEGTLGFADLGIEPETLEDLAAVYLRRYRPRYAFSSFFLGKISFNLIFFLSRSVYIDQPGQKGAPRLSPQRYHVVD
jgi:NADH dehydrogenase (ubiquinone) 1 alpha subcomplex subunit 9